jgi:heme/copper-type cytochrome/quinol oxidase subunit 3
MALSTGPISSQSNTPQSRRAATIGLRLMLASLSMIFLAGIMLYVLLRIHVFGNVSPNRVELPDAIWGSTAVLFAGGICIQRAVAAIRLERVAAFRTYLVVTLVLALAFLAIQFPCLWVILQRFRALDPKNGGMFGLAFCLILLHAAHVIGGVVALWVVTVKAMKDRYDHENYQGVRHAAVYWHFLDIVWVAMLAVFLIMG